MLAPRRSQCISPLSVRCERELMLAIYFDSKHILAVVQTFMITGRVKTLHNYKKKVFFTTACAGKFLLNEQKANKKPAHARAKPSHY